MSSRESAGSVHRVLSLKVIIALVLMASTPIWIRMVDASSLLIGLVRLMMGLSLTGIYFRRDLKWGDILGLKQKADKPNTRLILPAIGFLFAAHWYTYFESIQRSSASLAILALSTYGIHVT